MPRHTSFCALIFSILFNGPSFAAEAIDLHHHTVNELTRFFQNESSLKVQSSEIDNFKITHTRLQQYYQGHQVWGGDCIIHSKGRQIKNDHELFSLLKQKTISSSLDGIVYGNLARDLQYTPNYIFQVVQEQKALQQALQIYHKKTGRKKVSENITKKLIVFIDENTKAHWAFYVSFTDRLQNSFKKPAFILDAMTFEPYLMWDDLKTLDVESAGGFGGNGKMGEHAFDGLPGNFQALRVMRDPKNFTCYLQNEDVTVKDMRNKKSMVKFICDKKIKTHNGIYWDADFDKVNGAYSPANDALYIGKVIKDMYQKWYGIPVLMQENKPMMLDMIVHENMENAYWDGKVMAFGDGGSMFYPLVSIGVGAHEISHGFTEQHSNLQYYGASGGLNESFSDMAAQAAEYFSTKNNNWLIGAEIIKEKNSALRYMNEPRKDCGVEDLPGETCSIDNLKDFHFGVDVHFSSGIYNKMFYLLSTTPNWNVKKAFDVMVRANMYYWTPSVNFKNASCGILGAAKDLGYNRDDIVKALFQVGIDSRSC